MNSSLIANLQNRTGENAWRSSTHLPAPKRRSPLRRSFFLHLPNTTLACLSLIAIYDFGAAVTAQGQTIYEPYTFTTLAGLAGQSGSADGAGPTAQFLYPTSVAVDNAGNIYVADTGNRTIRKITPAGVVSTLAGSPGNVGDVDGTGSAASFEFPAGVAVDNAGNVYVGENGTIRKITPAGVVTTLAGSPDYHGDADGTGSAARFNGAYGVAVDSAGNVYAADTYNSSIRKITPAGVVTTLAGGITGSADGTGSDAEFYYPNSLAVDRAGNLFVADTFNYTIRKVTPDGVVSTLAGSPLNDGSADGTGRRARFDIPFGIAVDDAGTLFVADTGNSTIRKIDPAGVVSTIAGSVGNPGSADGSGSSARFSDPSGVAVDSAGHIYVADSFNHTIRRGGWPTGRQYFETEALRVQAVSGMHSVLSDARMSGGSGTRLVPNGPGGFVSYSVPVAKAGTYKIRVGIKVLPKGGVFQLSIDGVNQGKAQDEYKHTIKYKVRNLGTVTFFAGGNKTFRFFVSGRNKKSHSYRLVLDYIELVPKGKDVDDRANQSDQDEGAN